MGKMRLRAGKTLVPGHRARTWHKLGLGSGRAPQPVPLPCHPCQRGSRETIKIKDKTSGQEDSSGQPSQRATRPGLHLREEDSEAVVGFGLPAGSGGAGTPLLQ